MKKIYFFILIVISLSAWNCRSGLVTMTNACYDAIQNGQSQNASGNFDAALDQFNRVLDQCKAYDAKEKGYAGKAEALNGLKRYNEAIDASNSGLQIKSNSIDNLFQRAEAYLSLDRGADAKADLSRIIDLSQKNKNVKERATVYAKIAEIDMRKKMYDDAADNLQNAISLDSTNASFYLLKGDLFSAQNNFKEAGIYYDRAITAGADRTASWQAKTEGQIKYYQQKYQTTSAAELASHMSNAEKQDLCSTIRDAKINGVRNMNIDLLQVTICK